MRRSIMAITAAAFVASLPGARASTIPVIDYSPLATPDLSTQAPWTPSTVRLAQDLAALEQYRADLMRFHAWLERFRQKQPKGGNPR
jgi:hypothetical protein